jgi:hypothetical protein
MRRDMTLVRDILLEVEARSDGSSWVDLSIDGRSPEEIAYHVKIMSQAGLVEAIDVSAGDFDWRASSLTWEGHEFLDAARNNTVWRKALQLVRDKGSAIPFEVLKPLLLQWVRSSLEA